MPQDLSTPPVSRDYSLARSPLPRASESLGQRPMPKRRGSSPGGSVVLSIQPTPVPPSLLRRMTPESAVLHLQPSTSLGVLSGAMRQQDARMSPSPRNAAFDRSRAPSPLPPPVAPCLPSELDQMSQRLSLLVGQSNAYVQSLTKRLEAVEHERQNWGTSATLEQLQTFLEMHPEFATLDVTRIQYFGLPLTLWHRVAAQIISENPNAASGLEGILYWRARSEAETLGMLHSDRRSSEASSDSYYPLSVTSLLESRRGSVGSNSLLDPMTHLSMDNSPGSRRPSLQTHSSYFGPRRSSSTEERNASIAEEQ